LPHKALFLLIFACRIPSGPGGPFRPAISAGPKIRYDSAAAFG